MKSLQETFAPNNKCFGCGPSNDRGLRIRSMVDGDTLSLDFSPQPHHQAFENILSGGIVGTLLDCHSNWCAAYFIMKFRGEKEPPCCVTAKYSVELLAPTPMDQSLRIIATPTSISDRKGLVNAQIFAGDVCTAKCEGIFVAVKPGHPGYHRW